MSPGKLSFWLQFLAAHTNKCSSVSSGSDELCVSISEGGGGAEDVGWQTWICLGVEDISVWWVKFSIKVEVDNTF